MEELERAVIEETGDSGYFKDIVARQDINEVKKIVEEVSDAHELTQSEAETIYNNLYKEIFG